MPFIGTVTGNMLLDGLESPELLWKNDKKELMRIQGLGTDFLAKVSDKNTRDKAEHLYDKYIKNNFIKMTSLCDSNYPPLLRHIDAPPVTLFYRGNINVCSNNNIAGVVGSRKCTAYGLNATRAIVKDLAAADYCIVSGMARGIDSQAHKSALDAGGTTCAVLGCGVDIVYPPENKNLMDIIIEKGAVISEYPPEVQPLPRNFPARNRIISGLCRCLIVMEAGKRSGTLITADFAQEQGRDVFALPGNIFSPESQGTNQLIKDGAAPITSAGDVFEEYFDKEYIYNNSQGGLKGDLLKSIGKGITRVEALLEQTGADVPEIQSELLELETDGFIRKMPNGEYLIDLYK